MKMPDYRTPYYKLFRDTEKAIQILVAAQQECEAMYLRATDIVDNETELPEDE